MACPSGNNGAIDLTVTGGIAPYIFTWSNGASTEDLSSLTAGNYSVSVTDANGCTASTSATVTQPAALVLTTSSTPASC
ncbi:MAG: adhesin, partial [Betaproteobacteria bacterium]|nr:adhesin [Betaproteobacteria bacterium]